MKRSKLHIGGLLLLSTYVGSVAKEDDAIATVKQASADFDGINGLVNNAGIFRDGLLVKIDRKTGGIKKFERPSACPEPSRDEFQP